MCCLQSQDSSPDLLTLNKLLLSLSLIILPFLGRHHLPLCFFKVERQSHALPCSFLLQIKPRREPYKQSWQGESLLSLPSIQSSSVCTLFSEIHKRIIPLLLIGMHIHIKEARWVLWVLNVNASLWMILSKPFLTLPKGRGKTCEGERDSRSVESQWTNLTHDLGCWVCFLWVETESWQYDVLSLLPSLVASRMYRLSQIWSLWKLSHVIPK